MDKDEKLDYNEGNNSVRRYLYEVNEADVGSAFRSVSLMSHDCLCGSAGGSAGFVSAGGGVYGCLDRYEPVL